MLPKVSQLHTSGQQLLHMVPAFTSWQYWLTVCAAEAEVPQQVLEDFSMEQGIRLLQVSFKHPLGHQPLTVPDLFIPARQTTVIVGPTGSGKTTLLDLISGLNRPDNGQVQVDGHELTGLTNWRQHIAYVPQDSAILDGTLRDNLCWGTGSATDAQLQDALNQAAASEFVARLPQGLDTWVGERGVRLSGGEKQRLALARALLRGPQLLILDEATSALDREHQQLVLQALRELRGRMTLIVVTHRQDEMVAMTDGMVRVEAGRVSRWMPAGSVTV
jgi:ATP-binding cassette subfamily C protein